MCSTLCCTSLYVVGDLSLLTSLWNIPLHPRKMQVSGATTDLSSKGQGVSDSSNMKFKEEPELEDSHKIDKVRCLCGSSLQADSMIKVTM